MSIWLIFLKALIFLNVLIIVSSRRIAYESTIEDDGYWDSSSNSTDCLSTANGNSLRICGLACTQIPGNLTVLPHLTIQNTAIPYLESGDLDQFSTITSLTIDSNPYLGNIMPGVFEKMSELVNLSISENAVMQIPNVDVFKGLVKLQNLKLVKSNFNNFHCVAMTARPSILPSLISLDVSNNALLDISAEDTEPLCKSTLEYLSLSVCSLNSISSSAFQDLPHLVTLNVFGNNLYSGDLSNLILNIAKSSPNFSQIYLGNNYVSDPNEVLQAIAQTSIRLIGFVDSRFSTFNTDNLPALPEAEYIDFSSSGASGVTNNTFTTLKLPKIQYLYLAHNQLLSQHFTMTLPTLRVLDLTDNTFSSQPSNSIFRLGTLSFNASENLEYLSLGSNPVKVLRYEYFQGLRRLKELLLFNASLSRIEPGAFADLESLQMLDLSKNLFESASLIGQETFVGLGNLKVLLLGRSRITCLEDNLTFVHTPKLEYLSLVGNNLLELHTLILHPLPLLQFVDISCNVFQSWDEQIFAKNPALNSLNVTDNQISVITPAMLEDFERLSYLNLADNPLSCSCQDLEALRPYVDSADWKGQKALGEALLVSQPLCVSPTSLRFRDFLKVAMENGTCPMSKEKIALIIVVVGIVGFITLGAAAAYFLRWHIKYWLFMLKQTAKWPCFFKKKILKSDGSYAYDAFVSYSNDDRGFVVRLVSMLESHPPHFRLCVFERDFHVGGVITANVVDCLMKSKRTILVLSDSFAKSTWCQWEMNLAQHKRLLFKDNRHGTLIMIKIGEIMDKHMTPSLRYLTKTRIYLEWSSDPIKQKVFWEKLRSALAEPLGAELYSGGNLTNNNNDKNQQRGAEV